MADINLFRGGSTPLAGLGADCACGPYPSTYPVPNRVANHMREQVFTLAASLDPSQNVNIQCVLCSAGNTGEDILNRKIGLMRIPPNHLASALRMVMKPGNGDGAAFTVYADLVDPVTGVVSSALTLPAGAAGNLMDGELNEFYPLGTSPVVLSGAAETVQVPNVRGFWSGNLAIEIGVTFTDIPTEVDLCNWTGSITLVAKVEGFDFGAN